MVDTNHYASFVISIYTMEIKKLADWFTKFKEPSLSGRYINLNHLKSLLNQNLKFGSIEITGFSENNLPIHIIKMGAGPKKMLFWSQMHGNESTTTKAIFDLIRFLENSSDPVVSQILDRATLYIIPMLSPDGALAYTRLNYNAVDLNRDAQDLTQKESTILRQVINDVKPDLAFNLHGQRTIYSAGNTDKSAVVSFLSPAGDADRTVTNSRKKAMQVIVAMNTLLQNVLPDQIGRYNDGFNINCIGDTLSSEKIPVILFEAGHYPGDYNREETRRYIFYSLVKAIHYTATQQIDGKNHEDYFSIPENDTCFYDILIRNVKVNSQIVDIGIQYEEQLYENRIKFIPKVAAIENLEKKYGHFEIIGNQRPIRHENDAVDIVEGITLSKFFLNNELFSIEMSNN